MGTSTKRRQRCREQQERERNFETVRTTVRKIVTDPQFKAGYRDRLAGRPPPRFYYAEGVRDGDGWGYERGRLTACWLQASGRMTPVASDIVALARAYRNANDEEVVL